MLRIRIDFIIKDNNILEHSKKYNVVITKVNEQSVTIKGTRKDILRYMTSEDYSGLDYNELLECYKESQPRKVYAMKPKVK